MVEISIIVPVYNVQDYLSKLVTSIQNQTFSDWEMILVDDGSTDQVHRMIEKYEKLDCRIKSVIRPNNGGAALARKCGLQESVGTYVCFFDADDWAEPTMLERMYQLAETKGADVVCCGYYEEYSDRMRQRHFKNRESCEFDGKEAIRQVLKRTNVLPHPWNKMYRRNVLKNAGFIGKKAMGEDYIMVLCALYHSEKVVQIDHPLYHYILRKGSTLDVGFNEFYQNGFYSYRNVKKVLLRHFPGYRKQIMAYHWTEDMAIMASMFKNSEYDPIILDKIIHEVRKNILGILKNKDMGLRFKISGLCIFFDYRILRFVYMLLYRWRNRRKL